MEKNLYSNHGTQTLVFWETVHKIYGNILSPKRGHCYWSVLGHLIYFTVGLWEAGRGQDWFGSWISIIIRSGCDLCVKTRHSFIKAIIFSIYPYWKNRCSLESETLSALKASIFCVFFHHWKWNAFSLISPYFSRLFSPIVKTLQNPNLGMKSWIF